jgi:hypothetical protein
VAHEGLAATSIALRSLQLSVDSDLSDPFYQEIPCYIESRVQ